MSKRTPVMLVALLVAVLLPAQALAAGGRLLVVLSEANSITLKNGKRHGTGYFLSELMVPAAEVARFGYEIVVATPTGKKPTVDPASDAPGYFKDAAEYKTLSALHAQMVTIRPPLSLRDLDEKQLSSFDGVFFPGGHAPLTDLVSDPGVNRILRYFHERSLPTALICHGPVALLASRKEGSPWLYQGYKMTGFSTAEEKIAQSGALGGEVAFFLDEAGFSVVRTYTAVLEWRVPEGGAFLDAFASRPARLPAPAEIQGEAIAYQADGHGLVTASEGRRAPVYLIPCAGLECWSVGVLE